MRCLQPAPLWAIEPGTVVFTPVGLDDTDAVAVLHAAGFTVTPIEGT